MFKKDWKFYHNLLLYIVGFSLWLAISYGFYLIYPILGVIFGIGTIFGMLIKIAPKPSAPERSG